MASLDGGAGTDTTAERLYEWLRSDIVGGVFPPGTHLVKRVLAGRYNAGAPVVVEALIRLEADGLVESSPQLGAFVMGVGQERVVDEIILREAVEAQAARLFAERASMLEKGDLLRAAEVIDRMRDNLDPEDPDGERVFESSHCEWHLLLGRLCGSALLLRQMRRLWHRRMMLVKNEAGIMLPCPLRWHSRLAEALSQGDVEVADRAMRRHLGFDVARAAE